MEILELGARLGAEAVHKRLPCLLVGSQCLALATGATQGQHELGVESLSQRMLGGQRTQIRDQFAGPAKVQAGVDVPFHGLQPHLLQ